MTDRSGVALVALYLALVKASGNVLFIVLQSGFFKAAGVAGLPWVYAALNLGYIAVQAAFIQRLKARAARHLQVLVWALVGALALRLALPAEAGAAGAALALLGFMGFDLLFNQFFLHYVSGIFPLQEGKRALPVLHAATSLSFIASGLLLRMALAVASPRTMLAAAALGLVAAQLCFGLVRTRFGLRGELSPPPGKAESPRPAPPGSPGTPRRLGAALVAMAFFTMASKYLLDFLYSREVTATYASEAELASFFAGFTSLTDLAVVASQLVLAGPALRRIGIAALLGVMPAVVLAATLGTLVQGGFAWVLATQFLYTYLAKTFHTPASSLVLPVLPGPERLAVMSRIGMASSTGSLLVSLGLMAFQARLGAGPAFGLLALLLVGMLECGRRVASAYPAAVKGALARAEGDEAAPLAEALDGLEPDEVRDTLARMLTQGEPEARAAIRLAALRGPACLEELLLPLWGRSLPGKAMAAAVRALARCGSAAARPELLALLADPVVEPRVRADLAEALGQGPAFPGLRAALAARLSSEPPRLAAAAAWALVEQADDPAGVCAGLATLKGLLALEPGAACPPARPQLGAAPGRAAAAAAAADPARRAAALAVLGRARHEAFVPELAACLDDPAGMVARQALDGLAATGGPEAIAALRAYLERGPPPELAERARRGLEALASSLSASTRQLLTSLPEDERSLATALAGRLGDRAARDLLDRVLRLPEARPRRSLAAALGDPAATRALARLLADDPPRLDPRELESALCRAEAPAWEATRALVPALADGGLGPLAAGLLLARLAGLSDPAPRPALVELAEVAAGLGAEPERLRQAFAALGGPDPFRASLAEELLGLQLPRGLATALVARLRSPGPTA